MAEDGAHHTQETGIDRSSESKSKTDIIELKMLLGGDRVSAVSGVTFPTINPATGQTWARAPLAREMDVDGAVRAASQALEGQWGMELPAARARILRRMGDVITANHSELARLETTDNGKVLRETAGQMLALSDWFDYFAGIADKIEGTTIPSAKPGYFIYTEYEPLGVVAVILPWNSPLLLLTMSLAPALAAGCTVVVKPAQQTPASALKLGELFEDIGLPPGVFNVITGDGETGRLLASHPGVAKVAFTGSTSAGISVMKSAAEHLAPVTLELGGKSPNIVFADCDLAAASQGVIAGIFAATGQTCVAGSRLLVEDSVHDDLLNHIVEIARAINLGDPLEGATEMGPIAFIEQMNAVLEYVKVGQEEGATLLCGGRRSVREGLQDGYFVEPTIFDGVTNDMRIAQEEIFGPVLSVISFSTEEEAIRLANGTQYGLAAGVWTQNLKRAHRVARALRAGTIWINCYRMIAHNVPFGGQKRSGIGRENGVSAVSEFLETKSVWVDLTENTRDPFVLG